MTEYIDSYRAKINEASTRSDFPEITDSETPVWRGNPSMLSMVDKYILAVLVFLVHLLFFIGDPADAPEGEGQVNAIIGIIFFLVDKTGVMGFVVVMLVLTKVNHYANFSTSGNWTSTWLMLCALIPFAWKALDIISWASGIAGTEFDNPLPAWQYVWFLPLGAVMAGLMALLTLFYQRSFQYAITDRRVHIRKNFMHFDSSVHGIAFQKIENLKADPTLLGRLLGFGNVHVVTGSGVGLQVESLGMSVGAGAAGDAAPAGTPAGVKKVLSMLFGFITKQRQRTVLNQDPADCLYGIRNPMKIYRLINELMDANMGPTGQAVPDSEQA